MKKNHIGAIKGMAIANIVVSAVYAACLVMAMMLMLALGSFVVEEALYGTSSLDSLAYEGVSYDDPSNAADAALVAGFDAGADMASAHLHSAGHHAAYGYGYGHGHDGDIYDLDDFFGYGYGYDASADAAQSIYNTAVVIFLLIPLLLSILSLVAGILVLINVKRPEKLQFIMVWSIIGAIASGLSCSLPCLVMFVLSAVFANSDKALYRARAAQAYQTAQTAQTAAYAAPYAEASSVSPAPGAVPSPAAPAPEPAQASFAADSPVPSAPESAAPLASRPAIPLPAADEVPVSLKRESSFEGDEDEAAASDEKRED